MEDVGWVNSGSNTGKRMSVTTGAKSDEHEVEDVGRIPSRQRGASVLEESQSRSKGFGPRQSRRTLK